MSSPRREHLVLLVVLGLLSAGASGCLTESAEDESAAAATESSASELVVARHFQNGISPTTSYAGAIDTTLQQALPTTTDGSATTIRPDSDNPAGTGQDALGLLRFDLASIPVGSVVSSVTLTVNVTNRTTGTGYSLYPLKRAWSADQATWLSASSGSAWATAGARGATDRSTLAIGNLNPSVTGKATITLNADGVAAVQAWVNNPSQNFGFVVDSANNADGLAFDSANASVAANRPDLTVSFTAPEPVGNGTGLTGEYFTGVAFNNRILTRTDATINFNWPGAPVANVPADGFSVRWTGQVLPRYSQTYTFFTTSDDGVRVWVNGQKIIDNWTNHGPVENSGSIALTAGSKVDVKVEYYENTGGAVAQLSWSSSSQAKQIIPASQLFPAPPPPSSIFPVYTQAEIYAWSTSNPEYTRLANSWAGNVSRPHTAYGTQISSVERDLLKDESGYIKVQAVLWAADGNVARRNKVVAMLNELRAVTSFEWDAVEQYRLVAGWACTNLAQAAAIVGYRDAEFTRFLVNVAYPILDWTGGGNWHASFADSKLAIATYVGDAALYADAKAYFNRRIAQSFYHSAYDGTKIVPLRNDAGALQTSITLNHWGGNWGPSQINSDFTFTSASLAVDGANAERTRDLGHVSMGLGAWMHGARTILAHGDSLEPQAYDRLRTGYAYHAKRVLTYLTTGVIPAPTTLKGDGGGSLKQGWFGARKLFGSATPADVITLCGRSEVIGYPPAGANHMVAEQFADGL